MKPFTPEEVKILLTTLECHQHNLEEAAIANHNLIVNIRESHDEDFEPLNKTTDRPRAVKELRNLQYLCRLHGYVFAHKEISKLIMSLMAEE